MVAGPDDIELAWQLAVGQGERLSGCWPKRRSTIEFEVSLLAVRTDGPQGPVIEFCAPIGHRGAAGVLESWQPQQLSPAATDAAKSVAARIVKALGGRGVFSVELMINGDEVYFADVTACPHAERLGDAAQPAAFGVRTAGPRHSGSSGGHHDGFAGRRPRAESRMPAAADAPTR